VAIRARRRAAAVRVLTATGMTGFVLAVYVAVVLGFGALLGRGGSPSVWLSVLATGVVALAFEPVRVRLRGWLGRMLHQDRVRPEQVLARFASSVGGLYRADELPLRMAEVLAEGTASERAEVWLIVHDGWELAAVWPPAARDLAVAGGPPTLGEPPGNGQKSAAREERRSLPVRHGGAVLGAFSVVPGVGRRLTPLEERLFTGLCRLGFSLTPTLSPILPIIIGRAETALHVAEQLLANDIFAPAIRPPTVPAESSRVRVTVTSEHTAAQIDQALAVFERAGKATGVL